MDIPDAESYLGACASSHYLPGALSPLLDVVLRAARHAICRSQHRNRAAGGVPAALSHARFVEEPVSCLDAPQAAKKSIRVARIPRGVGASASLGGVVGAHWIRDVVRLARAGAYGILR